VDAVWARLVLTAERGLTGLLSARLSIIAHSHLHQIVGALTTLLTRNADRLWGRRDSLSAELRRILDVFTAAEAFAASRPPIIYSTSTRDTVLWHRIYNAHWAQTAGRWSVRLHDDVRAPRMRFATWC
jgi:hypothetical protein